MSTQHHLIVIWQRRWWVLGSCLLVGGLATVLALMQPRAYTADAQLVLDARPDPMGSGFMTAIGMATQLEVIKSEKVTARVAELLIQNPSAELKDHLSKLLKGGPLSPKALLAPLQGGLTVEPLRGSNIISITYASSDAAVAVAAVNAYAKAAMDISVEMRVDPTRESAEWLQNQSKTVRANLEAAQAKLSQYQRERGIVSSGDRLGEETSRLTALEAALVSAEAQYLDAQGRQRGNELAPEVQQSATVSSLRAQLGAAELKLSEISGTLGSEHPQRIALETQVAGLRDRLAKEVAKVAGGSDVSARASRSKVDQLRAMVDAQKKQLLSLGSEHDQISVLQRDVETARRAYESVSQRASQMSLESQSTQASLRVLDLAEEAADASGRKKMIRIVGGFVAGLVLAIGVCIALELRDLKVRCLEDLAELDGVTVIGVLHPAGSRGVPPLGLLTDRNGYSPPLLTSGTVK